MVNLLTHNDKYRIHATLGSVCLIQFILRLTYAYYFNDAFIYSNYNNLVNLHILLNLSSIFLHLPEKRNFNSPMIWPEFRLHNLIFCSRNIIATQYILYFDYNNYLYQHLIILIPCLLADIVTKKLGNKESRTTNSMPYPDGLLKKEIDNTKFFYTCAQVHATLLCINHSSTLCYFCVLAIQMASFMMTLVRKRLASSKQYHCYYTLSLLVPYLLTNKYNYDVINYTEILYVLNFCMFLYPRIYLKINKYLLWILIINFNYVMRYNNIDLKKILLFDKNLLSLYKHSFTIVNLDNIYKLRWMFI